MGLSLNILKTSIEALQLHEVASAGAELPVDGQYLQLLQASNVHVAEAWRGQEPPELHSGSFPTLLFIFYNL